ncbi:tyrosine-type recombinase/integrase [Desulfoscipio gibsoniae]|uniref:Site-specific recombinase XerC n=1 Tax=Desulfoscipio gibsoniae DSM 7213 TaxID=767817 RepID=R4KEY1_9FIRM|nr:site-specific integrase [Desulfoscipio gibsoniae]AGL01144.1 site-specific recombinase XerC [Desulfoscipio gibsoniae DSM 7213]
MAEVKRRGVNKYQISIYLGRDKDGKRIIHYETFHGNKTQANHRAAELEVEMKRRVGPKAVAMNVDEYLSFWLKRIQNSVDEGTYRTYTFHVKRLNPLMKNLPMYGLNSMDFQERLSCLSISGLKPKTIKGICGTLKTALRQAVAWGLLITDPTVGLRTPRVPKQEKNVLDGTELMKLLNAARKYKHHLIVRVVAITGMRLGEVLGLKWKDVDFQSGTVAVQRAVNTRRRKLKPEPKTQSSRRTIPLDEETLIFLNDLKNQYKETNPNVVRETLIFHADYDVNIPVRDNSVRRTIKRIVKAAVLPSMTVHDLRHTAGSLLVAAGYPLPMVSSFLGHSSPATTTAVYAHAIGRGINVTNALHSCQADSQANA